MKKRNKSLSELIAEQLKEKNKDKYDKDRKKDNDDAKSKA